MTLQLLDPQKQKVARIISFNEPFTKTKGFIGYLRPLTSSYSKDTIDDFDNSLKDWLESFNLENVHYVNCTNIIFEDQISQLQRIYNNGRPTSKLLLTCYGDNGFEELKQIGHVKTRLLDLPIYWNALDKSIQLDNSGFVTFDKDKEAYFFEIIDNIESL